MTDESRSAGVFGDAPVRASRPAASLGSTKAAALFCNTAIGKPRRLANPYSTYPIDPSLILIRDATPSLPVANIEPAGHSISLPTPRPLARHPLSIAARWLVKA